MYRLLVCLLIGVIGGRASVDAKRPELEHGGGGPQLRLGAFSISLAVKDIAASRAFYEKLGFRALGFGDPSQRWMILQNGTSTIGLFQGMFEKNIMTFNPGWDSAAKPVADFDDVREIQDELKGQGLQLVFEADATSSGPASLMLVDPDGNQILIDQHVPRPEVDAAEQAPR